MFCYDRRDHAQSETRSQRANCHCLLSNVSSDATNLSVVAVVELCQVPIYLKKHNFILFCGIILLTSVLTLRNPEHNDTLGVLWCKIAKEAQ